MQAKELTTKAQTTTKLVKDKNGNIIGDEEGRMKRWMEYFSELLNAAPPAAPITSIEPEWDKLDIDMSDPNEEQIKKCIKQLKITKQQDIMTSLVKC